MVGDVNSDALRKAWKASVRGAHRASLSSSLRSVVALDCFEQCSSQWESHSALVPLDALAKVSQERLSCQWVSQTQLQVVVSDSCQIHQDGRMGQRARGVGAEVPEG